MLELLGLKKYAEAFEDEGYDDVRDLAGLSAKELDELTETMEMKTGHKKKLVRILAGAQKAIQRYDKREEERIQAEEEQARADRVFLIGVDL